MSIKRELEQAQAESETARQEAKNVLDEIERDGLTPEREQLLDLALDVAESADETLTQTIDKAEAIQARADRLASIRDRAEAVNGLKGVHVPDLPAKAPPIPQPAIPRRHHSLRNFQDADGVSAAEQAYRFGSWALSKIGRDVPRFAGAFPVADQFCADQFGEPLAVHGGRTGTSGGFVFVPDEFSSTLITLRELRGTARQLMTVRPMASDTRLDPRRISGLTASYVGESAAATESTATFDQVRLTAKKLMVVTRISSELSEDSVLSLADELAVERSYAIADAEDSAAWIGGGTSTHGGIVGAQTRLDELTAGTAPGLTLGAGNLYSELTLANFASVMGSLPQASAIAGEVYWVCHKSFYHQTMVALILASGGATSTEVQNGFSRPIFMGYPVAFTQVMPSVAANSQIPVLFGNFQQGATFGDRRSETISFSDQASGGSESVWERDEVAVKCTSRFDVAVHSYGSDTEAGPICGLQLAAS